MKKTIYLCLLILPAVLILGGCGKKVVNNQSASTTPKTESGSTKISATAKEMLKSGKSLYCTFSFTDKQQGVSQSGKFYVDGVKARFSSEAEMTLGSTGKTIKAYMVTDGDFAYSWNNMDTKTGYKINLNEATTTVSTKKGQPSENLDERAEYDCQKWVVDNSKFALPSGMKFTDLNAMMKNLSAPASLKNVDVCSLCNQIPDAKIKADCQKSNCK